MKSPHACFWGLLKQTDDYNEVYKEDIKRSWVLKYSKGKTNSLSELLKLDNYAYIRMLADMRAETNSVSDRQNRQRKKLLALIYEFCKHAKYTCTKPQAVKIACRACGVTNYNDTQEPKVIAAIKAFERNEAAAWVTAILDKAAKEVGYE